MNEEQAIAVVHSVTGVPEEFREHALVVAYELGLNLLKACQTLDGDTYGSIELPWK